MQNKRGAAQAAYARLLQRPDARYIATKEQEAAAEQFNTLIIKEYNQAKLKAADPSPPPATPRHPSLSTPPSTTAITAPDSRKRSGWRQRVTAKNGGQAGDYVVVLVEGCPAMLPTRTPDKPAISQQQSNEHQSGQGGCNGIDRGSCKNVMCRQQAGHESSVAYVDVPGTSSERVMVQSVPFAGISVNSALNINAGGACDVVKASTSGPDSAVVLNSDNALSGTGLKQGAIVMREVYGQHMAMCKPVDLAEWLPAGLKLADDEGSDPDMEVREVVKSRGKRATKGKKKRKPRPGTKGANDWGMQRQCHREQVEPPAAEDASEAYKGVHHLSRMHGEWVVLYKGAEPSGGSAISKAVP